MLWSAVELCWDQESVVSPFRRGHSFCSHAKAETKSRMAIEDTNVNNQDHRNEVSNNRLDDFRIILFVKEFLLSHPLIHNRYIEKNHVYLKRAGVPHNSNVLLMTIDNPREKVALRMYIFPTIRLGTHECAWSFVSLYRALAGSPGLILCC